MEIAEGMNDQALPALMAAKQEKSVDGSRHPRVAGTPLPEPCLMAFISIGGKRAATEEHCSAGRWSHPIKPA
jgi:hypothetical protein